jgi:predicted amidophosphoribosyltransferase
MGGVLAAATEAMLPGLCPHCDQPLAGNDRGLCGTCWAMVLPRAGASCSACGAPVDQEDESCLGCARSTPPQQGTVVWGEHDGVLRSAILSLKHGGRDDLAGPLALRLAAAVAATPWAPAIDLVSWVPSHPLRRIRRPYAAAQMLAIAIADRLNRPSAKLLVRHDLGRQAARTRARRLRLGGRAFTAGRSARKRTVLLIDDVITTGTTIRRAAAAVLAAGASSVFCAALAATPSPRRFT